MWLQLSKTGPGRPPFLSEDHPRPVNGMARATSTKCGWHSSHVMEGARALSFQRTLSLAAGQPSTPVLGTKMSAGLVGVSGGEKGSLGCRSGRLRRGLGAALDASVSAGEEKGWVSWAGETLPMPV